MHVVVLGAKDNNSIPVEPMAPAGLKCHNALAFHLAHYLCYDIFPSSFTMFAQTSQYHRQVSKGFTEVKHVKNKTWRRKTNLEITEAEG